MSHAYRLAVVPDVHMRTHLFDRALGYAAEGWPVVFLGDYVDNGSRPNDARFLRELFEFCAATASVPLLGNHDVAYLHPDRPELRVPGYEPATADAIGEVFAAHAATLRYAHRAGDFLLTHAGVSRPLYHTLAARYDAEDVDGVVRTLNECEPPERLFRSRQNGGDDPFDGPLWLRPQHYTGALQAEGITQVVGHSGEGAIRMRHNLWMVDVGRVLLMEWEGSGYAG